MGTLSEYPNTAVKHTNFFLSDGFILLWHKDDNTNMLALGDQIVISHDKERFKVIIYIHVSND